MTNTNQFLTRPSLIPRIFPWIYGNNDFRENNFVLLEKHHRPNTECWYEGAAPFRHTAHIHKQNPNLNDLVALGNHLSDRANWMFEAIGKLNVLQSEIANETILKIDLIKHTTEQIYKEIPENFAEAFQQMYVASFEEREEGILKRLSQLEKEIKHISKNIEAIRMALGGEIISSP